MESIQGNMAAQRRQMKGASARRDFALPPTTISDVGEATKCSVLQVASNSPKNTHAEGAAMRLSWIALAFCLALVLAGGD